MLNSAPFQLLLDIENLITDQPLQEFDAAAMRHELAMVSTWLGKILLEANT